MADTDEISPGLIAVDTMMAGKAKVTSAYLLRASEPALVETGPTTSLAAVIEGLKELGVGPSDLAHVIVTHIHLDHAGGVGHLAAQFPTATIWVHERGAAHLADPAKLVQSAGRIYGEERLRRLFGPVDPVPADRIRAVDDGDRVSLGDREIEVIYTPGHASHHVALIDSESGAVFIGDALGIHLPDVGVLRPATPPPDVDVEMAVASIERIRRRARSMLLFSHFGPVSEIDELCSLAARRLRSWAGIVRDAMEKTDDIDRISEILRARTAGEFDDALDPGADLTRYDVLATKEMNAAGLVRYWRKRRERDDAPGRSAGDG